MPKVYQYKCSNYGHDEDGKKIHWRCRFNKIYSGPQMCVKMEDDSEKILPHPLEDNRALELTKKSLNQLLKEGRIIFVEPEICLNCLKYKGECQCDNQNFVKIKDLEGKKCPECKNGIIKIIEAGIS